MLENKARTPPLSEIKRDDIITRDLLRDLRRTEWYSPWQLTKVFKNLLTTREGENMIEELGRAPLPTEFGDWTYIVFGDHTHGNFHEMLVLGNIDSGSLGDGKEVLVRIHSACRTNEIFYAVNCGRIAFQRNLGEVLNKTQPAVKVIFEPKYWQKASPYLHKRRITWEEVAP